MHIHYLILCISSIIYTQYSIADFSFKKIYSYVIPQKLYEEEVFEEYHPLKTKICTVKNRCGTLTITTYAEKDDILLKAVKKTNDPLQLEKLTFKAKEVGQQFIIEPTYDDTLIDGSIDFDLMVPQKYELRVSNDAGAIVIKNPRAPVCAHTKNGEIDIFNAKNSVEAITSSKGSITVHNPSGHVKAQTNKGNIIIHDAQGTVIANTNFGTIQMYAKNVPSTSTIKLATISGSIVLHLPPDVNADLQASTREGTITSDHLVTLKPQTTQLNKNWWKRLQKEIECTLGTGEAQIKLSSIRSDIKVLETKA